MWTSYVHPMQYIIGMVKIKVKDAVHTPCGKFGEVRKFSENGNWALVRFIGTDHTEWFVLGSLERSTIPDPLEEMRKLYGKLK